MQAFMARLNSEPDPASLDKTPDGKAQTVTISFIEMLLDEIFIGQWSTEGFTTKIITNEVVGELVLSVVHPITGMVIKRTGAAAIQIMVDKAPEGLQGKERNLWALSPENKKPNALDLSYPKLKAECLKNAAQSLGKIFGRDLNRKKSDKFNEAYPQIPEALLQKLVQKVQEGDLSALQKATAHFTITPEQIESLNAIKQLAND